MHFGSIGAHVDENGGEIYMHPRPYAREFDSWGDSDFDLTADGAPTPSVVHYTPSVVHHTWHGLMTVLQSCAATEEPESVDESSDLDEFMGQLSSKRMRIGWISKWRKPNN